MADDTGPRPPRGGGHDQGGEGKPRSDADPAGSDARSSLGRGKQEDPGGERGARQASGRAAGDQPPWANVFQNFYGDVQADGGVFGAGYATAGEQRGSARGQGRIEETEVAKIVQAYAEPACYAEAARALMDEGIIVLTGEAGIGRRAGAIHMLARVRSRDKPLVAFSPAITVADLAARSFDEGAGYLVSDKFDEDLAPELTDFHWRNVWSKVRRSKAHLVVTIAAGSRIIKPDVPRQFSWRRPEPADALRAHLGATVVGDEVIDKVAEALGPNFQLADVGEIARKISAADDIGEVLADLQETDRLVVARWLDEVDAEIPAVMEVAALAFVVGVTERVFEAELDELRLRIAEFAPEIELTSKEARAEIDLKFRQLRKNRSGHPLLIVRQVPVSGGSGSVAVRHVDFRVPTYRQHVLAELWGRLPNDFWTAMRRWLQDIAAGGHLDRTKRADLINSACIGLALLGLVAPDEVLESYLDPWTTEGASLNEQTMAVYVVWWMSMLDQLAPLALQTGILWAGQGSRTQRRLAAYAFSGGLGVRYPIEAVKRLSQLADRGEPLAHAQLFVTLAGQDADAVVVLREIRRRMDIKTDRPSADRLLDTVVELLSIRDARSGRPAVAVFLIANPDLAGDVAPLWARVLCMRPWRDRAITALRHTIGAIERSSSDPDALARSLGSAIGRELPQDERVILRSDVLMRDSYARDRDKTKRPANQDGSPRPQASEALETFLDACANPSREMG